MISPQDEFVSERGLTSQLPNDVLMQVFSKIDSIPHRFKLAAVNKRFRSCMFKQMKVPRSFKMEFGMLLCGHRILTDRWPTAVEALAAEARFNEILVSRAPISLLSEILRALLSTPACLTQVTKIQIYFSGIYSGDGLDSVVAKCPQLSVFSIRNIQLRGHVCRSPVLDLISALHGKPLTQLDVALEKCNQQDGIDLLRTVQPNMLTKLDLGLKDSPDFDVVPLVGELCRTSAQSIEEIILHNCGGGRAWPMDPSLTQLFALIPRLPSLCRLWLTTRKAAHEDPLVELVPALHLLASNEPRESQLSILVQYLRGSPFDFPWCQMLDAFRQVPGLLFNFGEELNELELHLGNVDLTLICLIGDCGDPLCAICRSCYPPVFELLREIVVQQENDIELDDLWLNPCMVGRVVADLNYINRDPWRALNAEMNEDRAMIRLEWEDGTQFQIALNTARCFDHSCITCYGNH